MTLALTFDIGLAAFVLGVAAWTVLVRDAFTAVVAFVVYGLLLAVVWVRLSAVDVALTEAAIGSGVTGMLLLGAVVRVRPEAASVSRPLYVAAGALCSVVTVGLAAAMLLLPDPAPTLAPAAMANLPDSGLGNPVTGVLFVYRALDTLLEKVVLVLALVGVWSLAPDKLWGGAPRLHASSRPDSILAFLAQLLPPVGIMLAIYMFWVGADHPGGAFQGGALLAAMWLLVMMAGLLGAPATGRFWLRASVIVGPAVFLAIGFAGFALTGTFLAYPAGYAKPLIVIAEAALTFSIGATLGLLALGPSAHVEQR